MSLCGLGEGVGGFGGFEGEFVEGVRRCHLRISNISILKFDRIEKIKYELKSQTLNLKILKLLNSFSKLQILTTLPNIIMRQLLHGILNTINLRLPA